jgi:hypothetical protein
MFNLSAARACLSCVDASHGLTCTWPSVGLSWLQCLLLASAASSWLQLWLQAVALSVGWDGCLGGMALSIMWGNCCSGRRGACLANNCRRVGRWCPGILGSFPSHKVGVACSTRLDGWCCVPLVLTDWLCVASLAVRHVPVCDCRTYCSQPGAAKLCLCTVLLDVCACYVFAFVCFAPGLIPRGVALLAGLSIVLRRPLCPVARSSHHVRHLVASHVKGCVVCARHTQQL